MNFRKLSRRSTLITFLILLLLSIFPLLVAIRYPNYLNDDSFITLTFAKNIKEGKGFIYNHPPAVQGTTTPLLTYLIAGSALFLRTDNLTKIAIYITALSWLGIPWLFFIFRNQWELENWQVVVLAITIFLTGWIGYLGMEAYLFSFLLIFTFSLYFRRNYFLAGLACGLLFLTRGEGILILPMLITAELISAWKNDKKVSIITIKKCLWLVFGFLLPTSIWLVYAQHIFGSFLPNTLSAKQAQLNVLRIGFFTRLITEWLPVWGGSLGLARFPYINLWWIFVALGLIYAIFRKRNWLFLACWIALYIIGYSILRVGGYTWYQLPIVFVLTFFFCLGLFAVVEFIQNRLKSPWLALLISTSFIGITFFFLAKPASSQWFDFPGYWRGESYSRLSQWFNSNTRPDESIASMEIGYLGYFTDNRIVDLAGLISPKAIPRISRGDIAWGFWKYRPDYFVYHQDFDWALAAIRSDPRFGRNYSPIVQLPGPGDDYMIIYKRQR
jgi:hypothetical protein